MTHNPDGRTEMAVPGNDEAVADPHTPVPAEPIDNPGLPPHEHRLTDVDEAQEKRAERQVATMFGLAAVFSILFVVAYLVFEVGDDPDLIMGLGASNLTLGLTLGMALLLIGIGTIHWARKLMSDVEIVEYRHGAASSEEDREAAVAAFRQGVEDSGIGRRPLIRNSLLGAVAMLGLPAVILLRDLGPLPGDALARTVWTRGMRIVNDVSGTPIRPDEVEIGQLVNAEPAVFFEKDADGEPVMDAHQVLIEKAKAAVILVRMQPRDITPASGRENWGVEGILCYS